jgi:hypothetical protein
MDWGGIIMGSSIGGIFGSNAQLKSNKQAQAYQQQMYNLSRTDLTDAEKRAQGYIQPYASVGRNALDALAYGMGLSGGASNAWDIPTDTKIGESNDPIWNYVLQQYKSGGGKIKGNLTDPRNASLLQQLQGQYTSAQQKAGANIGGTAGIGQGSLMNYGMDQYKQDVGYTPMVNSLAELQATPGYQFQLEQGLQGVNNSAAAKGGLLSGANMKALNDYSQGQAATGYQAAWDRAQNAYSNAFNRNQQKFSNLQSMANNGQNAAQTQGGWANNLGANLSNLNMGNATSMNDLYQNAGNIRAQQYKQMGGLGNQAILGAFGGENVSGFFNKGLL